MLHCGGIVSRSMPHIRAHSITNMKQMARALQSIVWLKLSESEPSFVPIGAAPVATDGLPRCSSSRADANPYDYSNQVYTIVGYSIFPHRTLTPCLYFGRDPCCRCRNRPYTLSISWLLCEFV